MVERGPGGEAYTPATDPCYDEPQTYSLALRQTTPPLHHVERGPGGEVQLVPMKENGGWHVPAVS